MKSMKRLLSLVLALAATATLLTGCGGGGDSGGGGGDAAGGKDSYELRIATHYNQEHLGYESLTRIKEKLEAESDGRLKVTIYPSSQLGDYTLTFQELSEGTIDMALIPIPSEYDSRLEMNFIPYLVNSYDDLEASFGKDSYFFGKYTEIMSDLNIKLLGVYAEGMIGLGFSSEPVDYQDVNSTNPDKKNMLVRAPAIEVYNLVTQDMGFSATTIPYGDLYTAMQTGVCDGWIGGTPQLNYSDFRDVIKYYVPYNVFVENIGYLMSQEVFDGMPEDLQSLIEETFMAEAVNSYKTAKEGDEEAIQKMKDYGITILELTDEEREAYKQHVVEVTWPKLSANIGEDILNELIAANSK
ncbi:MAG: TRAP transporter substrate-binding protein DctP [Agathobaculum sp.]|jgi:TRAP-type C4-dicarboxylate transport system substrate-binding protein|uniref:TRAP transporter substrate-binding protein DctP n=1 Tax=Agathobaculum sp. TaxID=2048138 RepID=UPI003D8B2522